MNDPAKRQKPKPRRRSRPPRIVLEVNGRPIPDADVVRELAASAARFQSRQRLLDKRVDRIDRLPTERRSVERAMLAVEQRIVAAMWVLQRSVAVESPSGNKTGWPPYLQEAADRYAQAVAAGGWISEPPRPSLPGSREIDAATEAQGWLTFLDSTEARVLVLAAMTKRGEVGRRIAWDRVRPRLPEFKDKTNRWFRLTYTAALRNIVTELTLASYSQRKSAA